MFSLAQAAKAAGKSKPTLVRAIKNGKLSAARNDDGSYTIDPAELARVFPLPGAIAGRMLQHGPPNGAGDTAGVSAGEVEGLRLLVKAHEETIRDLRQQRDRAQEQLTVALRITDQRPPPAPRRSWWPWRRA